MTDIPVFNGGNLRQYNRPEAVQAARIIDVLGDHRVVIEDESKTRFAFSLIGLILPDRAQVGDWLLVWGSGKISFVSAAEFEADWVPVVGAALL